MIREIDIARGYIAVSSRTNNAVLRQRIYLHTVRIMHRE